MTNANVKMDIEVLIQRMLDAWRGVGGMETEYKGVSFNAISILLLPGLFDERLKRYGYGIQLPFPHL